LEIISVGMKNNNTMILLVINNIHITFPAYIMSMFLILSGTTDPWQIPQNFVELLPELFKFTEALGPNS
jgi:hypothetical protein